MAISTPGKSNLVTQQIAERTAEAGGGLEDVECIPWDGPMGYTRERGIREGGAIPAVWSPGFMYDLTMNVEAYIIPKEVVDLYKLEMSIGFWGAGPRTSTRKPSGDPELGDVAFPVPTDPVDAPLTEADMEAIRSAAIDEGEGELTNSSDINTWFNTNNEHLQTLRRQKLEIIRENLTRVRIASIGPEVNYLPKNEDYYVVALGQFPASTRIGILLDKEDPSGNKNIVPGQFGWTREEYDRYLKELQIPQGDDPRSVMESRIRASKHLWRKKPDENIAAHIPQAGVVFNRQPLRAPAMQLVTGYPNPLDPRQGPQSVDANLAQLGIAPHDAVMMNLWKDPQWRVANPDAVHPITNEKAGGLA